MMLDTDPKVAATVILERLRAEGYQGGVTILKEYLHEVRPLFVDARSYQRTSHMPGELARTDWWEPPLSVRWGLGASRRVFGLVTSLLHSAAHAAVFCFSKRVADFLPTFAESLDRLGGVPEAVVVDRDSSMVVPRSRPGRLHPEVAALLGALRIRPIILRPRRPESKGTLATISRFRAVANVGRVRLSGFLAWLLWLAVHLIALTGFKNRVAVLFNWTVAFLGRGRQQRTITTQQVFARQALESARGQIRVPGTAQPSSAPTKDQPEPSRRAAP